MSPRLGLGESSLNLVEKQYQEQMDALTPMQRVERAASMFQWARETIARQIVAEPGPMSSERLKWLVAMRQYGSNPTTRAMIEEVLRATLEKVIALLQQHKIRYHLTGAVTRIAYGEPRMDVDIVIDNSAIKEQLDTFVESVITPALQKLLRRTDW